MDNITKIETENTGGGSMVDIITLWNGKVIVISEDYAAVYQSKEAFYESSNLDNTAGFIGGASY
jgi:uncharacterized protein YlzI (FlbEa/FlbD family)